MLLPEAVKVEWGVEATQLWCRAAILFLCFFVCLIVCFNQTNG